jgi:hypothetical protein
MKEKNNAGLEEAKKRIKEAKEKQSGSLDLSRLYLVWCLLNNLTI